MVADVRAAVVGPHVRHGAPASYTGDRVLVYTGKAGVAAITGNAGATANFSVTRYSASSSSGSNLLVNTTDAYTGRVPIDAGPALFVVTTSPGSPWTINPTAT